MSGGLQSLDCRLVANRLPMVRTAGADYARTTVNGDHFL